MLIIQSKIKILLDVLRYEQYDYDITPCCSILKSLEKDIDDLDKRLINILIRKIMKERYDKRTED